jgi:MFS family permease
MPASPVPGRPDAGALPPAPQPPAAQRPASLWRDRDFAVLWSGALVSEMGDAVTLLALPLTAILVLHAGALAVGLLRALGTAAFLLIALPAGVFVDRHRKRPLMIGADLGRMLLIGSIPAAAALGWLTFWQLCGVALGTGLLSVAFDVSYQSFVPFLVSRDQVADANSKMGLPSSFASVIGPNLAGGLVALAGAARAMGFDAASFAVSATSVSLLRTREPVPEPAAARHVRAEIAEGLRYVLGHRVLRRIAACTATANLFGSIQGSILVLFMLHDLHQTPSRIGLALSLGSLGGVLGGLIAPRLGRRVGTARLLWISKVSVGWVVLAIPLAQPRWGLPMVAAGLFVSSVSATLYNVAQVSYRQSVTPVRLLGRMNASIRWIIWGTLPLGALTGGWLGEAAGLRAAMAVGAAGSWLAVLWIVASPLIRQREIPVPEPG